MEAEFFAIKNFLDSRRASYEVFEHEPVYTSDQAARVRNEPLSSGVKSLVFKADLGRSTASSRFQNASHSENGNFILVLVPGDKKVDINKLREITGKNNIRMATPEEVLNVCSCEIGSVHPFGNLMGSGIKTYMDQSILQKDRVNFNVGLHTMTVRMSPNDLKDAINPEVVDLVKE